MSLHQCKKGSDEANEFKRIERNLRRDIEAWRLKKGTVHHCPIGARIREGVNKNRENTVVVIRRVIGQSRGV